MLAKTRRFSLGFYLLFLRLNFISPDVISTQTTASASMKPIANSTTTRTSSVTTSPTSRPATSSNLLPVEKLIEQFNAFRQQDVLNRMKQCSATMKLNEICEAYRLDERTNQLKRSTIGEFQSLEHVADSLVDRMAVQKLRKFCPIGQWCLGNLSADSVQFTLNIIRRFGGNFCTMEHCHHRLQIYVKSCPARSNPNVTSPTLKLFPSICKLHHEPTRWNQSLCEQSVVYFLHLIYAFWPQLEFCYQQMTNDSVSCSTECQTFDDLFHRVENQCRGYSSFLSEVSTFAWFKTINLKEFCEKKNISMRPAFISSVQTFFTQNTFWYRFHQKPIYTGAFVLIGALFVVTLSLAFYIRSKRKRLNSSNRRANDDYEYTRLHNASFELGASTESW